MLSRIQQKISRALIKVKVYNQKKTSPDKVYESIKSKPLLQQEKSLNEFTKYILKTGDVDYYQRLLQTLVPTLSIDVASACFVGNGIGGSSLNTFRKVSTNKQDYFEKIYFNSSKDFKRIHWLHENILNMMKGTFVVPNLKNYFVGDLVTITYFEYLSLTPLDGIENEQNCIQFSRLLYGITEKNRKEFQKMIVPDYLLSFKNHFQYAKNIESIKKSLNFKVFLRLEKRVEESKRVLTHGDIQKTNAYKDLTLIDWDTFGFFPIGFEVAFVFYRLLVDGKDEMDFKNWLEVNYKAFIKDEDWESFIFNSHFFLFVFGFQFFQNNNLIDFKTDLFKRLKE